MKQIQSIGILTSGGDSPGMNAAIRAVTRAGIFEGWKVYGIYRGFEGLINGEIKEFTSESVSNVTQRGGTRFKPGILANHLAREVAAFSATRSSKRPAAMISARPKAAPRLLKCCTATTSTP